VKRSATVLLAALSLAGCAGSGHRDATAQGASVQTIVLFPLNVVSAMPSELEEGAPYVEAELQKYLEVSGKSIVRPGLADAQKEWVASAAALRDEVGPDAMSFEGAARHLAQRLRAHQEYDVLVMPSLTFRPARLRTRRVSWDGVDRRLETVGEPSHSGNIILANTFHGEMLAPSLAVFVFSSSGELLFQGMGGLDLAHRARIVEGKWMSDVRWQLEVRPELFTDAPLLREGISVAFDPFLPRRDAGD
jgi:hypothetical protein